MASHGLNFVTGKDREQLLAWGRDVWQAARRAPAEPWQRAPLSDEQRRAIFDDLLPHGADAGIRKLFAATVFAIEAAHGIGEARYAPPEAAPVQLPEPAAWRDPKNFLPSQGCTYEKSTAKKWEHIYTEALYTEQQVRELLAEHGIKVNQ